MKRHHELGEILEAAATYAMIFVEEDYRQVIKMYPPEAFAFARELAQDRATKIIEYRMAEFISWKNKNFCRGIARLHQQDIHNKKDEKDSMEVRCSVGDSRPYNIQGSVSNGTASKKKKKDVWLIFVSVGFDESKPVVHIREVSYGWITPKHWETYDSRAKIKTVTKRRCFTTLCSTQEWLYPLRKKKNNKNVQKQ